MDEINRLWQLYNDYKETAEQHEFVRLFLLDTRLIPAYNDLTAHYSEEHAEIFERVLRNVLISRGVNLSE